MSWQEEARRLIALAMQQSHERDVDGFKIALTQGGFNFDLDRAVAELPSDCQGQADHILRQARATNLSDEEIAVALAVILNENNSAAWSIDDMDGMAGNPF